MLFLITISSYPKQLYEIFKEEFGDLAKKIPQHQIASYLGITPVALSRVLSKVRKKPLL
jgi:CRP-like cAMP-binding protein